MKHPRRALPAAFVLSLLFTGHLLAESNTAAPPAGSAITLPRPEVLNILDHRPVTVEEHAGDKSSTWMEQKTQEASTKRNEYVTKPLDIRGDIKVSAEKGSKVVDQSFNANMGNNM